MDDGAHPVPGHRAIGHGCGRAPVYPLHGRWHNAVQRNAAIAAAPEPGLLEHPFAFGQEIPQTQKPHSLIVQVIARDPERKETVDLTELEQHRELYQLRIFIDLNGDGAYAPDEQVLLDLPVAEPKLSPVQMRRAMPQPLASTTMTLPREVIGELQGAQLRISFPALLRPDPFGWCGTGMGTPWRDPDVVPFTPRLDLILPVVAELPGEGAGSLLLQFWQRNSRANLRGYYRLAACVVSEERPPGSPRWADDAFQWNDGWWRIAAVDASLSTITLAKLNGDEVPPAQGVIGGELPEWTGVDLNTGELLNTHDLVGKRVLLVLPTGSHPRMLDSFQELAEQLRATTTQSGAPLEILCMVDRSVGEHHLRATSTLPYRLLVDKDAQPSADVRGLRDLLDHWRGPLVILTDAEGKVILREKEVLATLLPKLQRMLSNSDGNDQRP